MSQASVLFVCLGNICRSPLAEAALREEAGKAGLDLHIDSAGTGDWHLGHPPDPRAQAAALRNGIDISSYRARLVTPEDFHRFDYIVALDRSNLADLEAMRPAGSRACLGLLLDYVEGREGQVVADPYHGEDEHFDLTWQDAKAGAKGLIRHLKARTADSDR